MKTRTMLAAVLLFACLTMPFAAAIAEDETQFLDKAYARLGLAIG